MIFKKQIINKRSIQRSNEDWKIIDEYLTNLLLKLMHYYIKKDRWIVIKKYDIELISPNITLSNSTLNSITYFDIKRFCKEHHLPLRFKNLQNFFFEKDVSFFYSDTLTTAYLIKV